MRYGTGNEGAWTAALAVPADLGARKGAAFGFCSDQYPVVLAPGFLNMRLRHSFALW